LTAFRRKLEWAAQLQLNLVPMTATQAAATTEKVRRGVEQACLGRRGWILFIGLILLMLLMMMMLLLLLLLLHSFYPQDEPLFPPAFAGTYPQLVLKSMLKSG
jgi:hypothetical protein